MTINELIKHLKKYPKHMRVIIPGYEDGCDDVDIIKKVKIHLNANATNTGEKIVWWSGRHTETDANEKDSVDAILLNK